MGSGGAQLVEQTRRLSHRTRNDSMSFIEQTIMKKRDFAVFVLHIAQAVWWLLLAFNFPYTHSFTASLFLIGLTVIETTSLTKRNSLLFRKRVNVLINIILCFILTATMFIKITETIAEPMFLISGYTATALYLARSYALVHRSFTRKQ